MRKFLIRWWFTANWKQDEWQHCISRWNTDNPLNVAAERHADFFSLDRIRQAKYL